jgi:hypothetical protein
MKVVRLLKNGLKNIKEVLTATTQKDLVKKLIVKVEKNI